MNAFQVCNFCEILYNQVYLEFSTIINHLSKPQGHDRGVSLIAEFWACRLFQGLFFAPFSLCPHTLWDGIPKEMHQAGSREKRYRHLYGTAKSDRFHEAISKYRCSTGWFFFSRALHWKPELSIERYFNSTNTQCKEHCIFAVYIIV